MVTLKLRCVASGLDSAVNNVDLANHIPLDVIIKYVEQDASRKPPKGSIWLMKMPAGAPGWHEIDHFATFEKNGLDENMKYDLIECLCPLLEGK